MVITFFLVFAIMFISLILDSNKKVTNMIMAGISSQNNKPFDTMFRPTMSNLATGKLISKFTNSVLMPKTSSSLYI